MRGSADSWRSWKSALPDILNSIPVMTSTLVGRGSQNSCRPYSEHDELTAMCAGSRLIVYPGAGNTFHGDELERIAGELGTFVECLYA